MMNILLTSAGRRSYLVEYFKEALHMAGVAGMVHAANSTVGPAFFSAHRHVVTPLIYDPSYIPFLLDYCRKWEIGLLVPLFDIDLPVLAAHREEFAKVGTTVVTAEPEAIEACNDKWKTYLTLKAQGIPVPETWLHMEEALKAVKEGKISYPLMVKPRWGMGSLSVYEADNEEELRIFDQKIRREIVKSYLKYESRQNIEESVIIQERISGGELGLDVINDLEGNYRTTIVKKKVAMRSGETDGAETVDIPELKAIGERLSELLRHRGNLDVDVLTADGNYYVLEMNARFGGGYPFSHAAGVHLPYALVRWAEGEEPEGRFLQARAGVRAQKDIRMLVFADEMQEE